MTHLTVVQILQTVDGTADYATQAAVNSHLAICPRCRAEVEFQRSLIRSTRRMPLPSVSDRFVSKVMAAVLPNRQHPLAAWVLNNMGNMFAMMAVLGVLTYVVTNPPPLAETGQEPVGNALVQQFQTGVQDVYAWLNGFLSKSVSTQKRAAGANGSEQMTVRLLLIGVSLAFLVLADRLWLSRLRARLRS